MATDKPRFSVTFTNDSFNKIQKYKQDNNISTQSKAVARLVELALSEIESKSSAKESPSAAKATPGENKIDANRLYDMLEAYGFVKDGQDLSDEDLRVLLSVGEIIRAWFEKSEK